MVKTMMSESVNELEKKDIASIQEEKAAHEKENVVTASFRRFGEVFAFLRRINLWFKTL